MLKNKKLSNAIKLASAMVLILALGLLVACGSSAGDNIGSGSSGSSVVSDGAGESSPSSEKISEERAKELALSHAEIGEADFIRVEGDYENGKKRWELEFYKDGFEYDYEIDAESGEVISFSKEKDDEGRSASKQQSDSSAKPESSQQISEEQAKAKALAHAGVSADEAIFGKVEFDRDDRRPHFELEFRVGRYEYDCSVDSESGQVFDFEMDYDD